MPRPARPAPRPGQGVVFGSFNSAPKINHEVVETWATLLRKTPHSRLLLKALEFDDPRLAPDLIARFENAGIAPERIEIVKLVAGYSDHLKLYHRVDIALDPFPYNGTTTTFEALFMGVPVVTVGGDRHVSRVSAMILGRLGLAELIASGREGYLAIAESLASDVSRRSVLHSSIRPRLLSSVLCDGPAFGGLMDAALRFMWRTWCGSRGA